MASTAMELPLDYAQIKKAAQALLAHNAEKQKSAEKLLLNEDQNVFMMITVWKIPPREQVIKITLPHGILPATSEVCLFTKDEPGLTAEQTENRYKKLLTQHGITNITEVISYKTLKTEYKPYEAKRRLLGRFSLFLSDDRVRRLLPSHLGKHFYKSKKAPLSVNLKAKDLTKEINKLTQGTILPVTNKGCCYTVRIGHTGLEAWKISQNVVAAAKVLAAKAPQVWKNVKILHLKTDKSVALPIFIWSNSQMVNVQEQTDADVKQDGQAQKKKGKNRAKKNASSKTKVTVSAGDVPASGTQKEEAVGASAVVELDEDDGEIPQLIPIETPPGSKSKKAAKPSPGKEIKAGARGSPILLGKRKTSPCPEGAVTQQATPGVGPSQQTPAPLGRDKKSKIPKQEVPENQMVKTPGKPYPKLPATPKMGKAVRSAKKAPKTPKRELRKPKAAQTA
ncbi:ribosomal L1 domain-containing protein 1 [Elgaria multicarinata webbii]|uniref:ribosomal L1 domain-containing protein 1 n=1 Tax=Elgaria multicarinata webbii TaxID=159646 RepID=UPI002FCCD2ED